MHFNLSMATVALLGFATAIPISPYGTHTHTTDIIQRDAKGSATNADRPATNALAATNALTPISDEDKSKREAKDAATNALRPIPEEDKRKREAKNAATNAEHPPTNAHAATNALAPAKDKREASGPATNAAVINAAAVNAAAVSQKTRKREASGPATNAAAVDAATIPEEARKREAKNAATNAFHPIQEEDKRDVAATNAVKAPLGSAD